MRTNCSNEFCRNCNTTLDALKFSKKCIWKKFPQISVTTSVEFCSSMYAYKFSKDQCGKMSAILTKKDSVVLLVAKTLSIRGSLYIWYSLQITLRLRGATPTNRHPLQSCGFSREILWHSCLEVVMNLYFNGKVCWKQYMLIKFQNISFVGLFWNLRQSLTKSSLPINVASHECPF